MNLLSMAVNLWRETGTGGPQPTTVVGALGEVARLVEWLIRADLEIQKLHSDWGFLWAQESEPLVQGVANYAAPVDLNVYDEHTFRLDGNALECVPYLNIRTDYRDPQENRPFRAVIMPDRGLRVDSTPDQAYTLTYDYWRVPQEMVLDDSTESIIPAAYHWAIIGRALMLYANFERAEELMPQADLLYTTNLESLESAWLPGTRESHKQSEGNTLQVYVE